jgi:hypothetical protein
LEQSNATVPVSSNTTDIINARAKPLNSDTNNTAINSTAGAATSEVAWSLALVNGNSSARGNGTSSVEGVLRQQLANQFRFVYSAKAAFNVQNLSAYEMFQVKVFCLERKK